MSVLYQHQFAGLHKFHQLVDSAQSKSYQMLFYTYWLFLTSEMTHIFSHTVSLIFASFTSNTSSHEICTWRHRAAYFCTWRPYKTAIHSLFESTRKHGMECKLPAPRTGSGSHSLACQSLFVFTISLPWHICFKFTFNRQAGDLEAFEARLIPLTRNTAVNFLGSHSCKP